MANNKSHFARLYSRAGDRAVRDADQIYSHLKTLPLIDRIHAAQQMPEVFMQAIILDHGDARSESEARSQIKSYFYVNSIINLHELFTRCKIASKKPITWVLNHVQVFAHRVITQPIQCLFQGASSPLRERTLTNEIDVMLKTILAAHAPTAAKERSMLQSISS
jgi:hypothetical protein